MGPGGGCSPGLFAHARLLSWNVGPTWAGTSSPLTAVALGLGQSQHGARSAEQAGSGFPGEPILRILVASADKGLHFALGTGLSTLVRFPSGSQGLGPLS